MTHLTNTPQIDRPLHSRTWSGEAPPLRLRVCLRIQSWFKRDTVYGPRPVTRVLCNRVNPNLVNTEGKTSIPLAARVINYIRLVLSCVRPHTTVKTA